MTSLEAPPAVVRLLSGVVTRDGAAAAAGPSRRLDLATHLGVHGPLPDTGHRSPRAADRLTTLIDEAGLTGRGGAAFPTAAKLEAVRSLRRRPLVVVNALEGEPASRKDDVLVTHAPHLVLDGAELVAGALGAAGIRLCVSRGRYSAAASLEAALAERRRAGYAAPPTEVCLLPERYIAGEESALVRWLDGGESLPTFRPDRPAVLRAHGRPALVHNAETLAHVALIARHGPAWFRSVGPPGSPGTTLVTVSGAVAAPGVVEVPMGSAVSAVLASAGCTADPAGVLVGGYGGAWLPAWSLATPYEPAALAAEGCAVGAGVLLALPPAGCGLAETARIARWMASESGGQCGPCVFGLAAVAEDVATAAFGRPTPTDIERLRHRLGAVAGRGACRHPDGVVRLVRSALTVFGGDLDHHVRHGPCRGARLPSVLAFPSPTEAPSWR